MERTQKPSFILSFTVAGALASTAAAYFFAQKISENLGKSASIEIALPAFDRLAAMSLRTEKITDAELSALDQKIETKIESAQAEKPVAARIKKVHVGAPRVARILRKKKTPIAAPSAREVLARREITAEAKQEALPLEVTTPQEVAQKPAQPTEAAPEADTVTTSASAPAQLAIQTEGLDQIPEPTPGSPSAASVPVATQEGMNTEEEVASVEEMMSIQLAHRAARSQFWVAIQNLETLAESKTVIAKAPEEGAAPVLSENEYQQSVQAYLDQVDATSLVVVEDEISTSAAAPAPAKPAVNPALDETSLVPPTVEPTAEVQVAAAPADALKAPAPTADGVPELNTQKAPALSATLSKLDSIPGMDEVSLPKKKPELPKITPQSSSKAHSKKLTAKSTPETGTSQNPPAARLIDPSETLAMNTHRAPPVAGLDTYDDPSLDDENDYSFLDSQSKPLITSKKTASSLSAPVSTAAAGGSNFSKNSAAAKKPSPKVAQNLKSLPSANKAALENLLRETSVANIRTAQRFAQNPAVQQNRANSVSGVSADPNGITINWNQASADRELISSVPAENALKIPELRKCDTALIGTPAFSTKQTGEVLSVCRRPLSLEGYADGTQARWWEVRESVDHWPTLIFQKPSEANDPMGRIPMLAANSAKALALMAKAKIQPNAGIVLGEYNGSFEVSLSGRTDSVLLFDSQFQIVESSRRDQAKYFAFLNVAPGAPLLYVRLSSGARGGSIPLVVRSGHVTYVRVPSPQARTLSLRILDAASYLKPKAVTHLSVRVIGQDGKTGVTNSKGEVRLNDVLVFGEYPVHVDVTATEKSYRHRYRLKPSQLKDRDLFYFGDRVIGGWVGQLEGGISPLSGMVVGAIVSLPQKEQEAYVRFQALEKRAPLTPEVYVLGTQDQLISLPKVNSNLRRFVGVQVPEGPQIPTAVTAEGQLLWSEMVVAQPGVVNVIVP